MDAPVRESLVPSQVVTGDGASGGRARWRWAVLAAGVALSPLAAWLAADAAPGSRPGLAQAAVALVVGWSFLGCGLAAWLQRPESRLGPLMALIGVLWLVGFLSEAEEPVPFAIGAVLGSAYLAVFVVLVLSLPGGRPPTRLDRALGASAFVIAVGVPLVLLMVGDAEAICDGGCPESPILLARSDAAATALLGAQRAVAIGLSLFTAGLLAARWRGLPPARRATFGPVPLVAGALFAALAVSIAHDLAGAPLGEGPDLMLALVFATFPVVVLAWLLRERMARGAVAEAVVELDRLGPRADLRGAIARALGDPTVEVVEWSERARAFLDAAGDVVSLPEEGSGRAAITVFRNGQPVAALIHEDGSAGDPGVAAALRAAIGIALERRRLEDELRERLREIDASRARITKAADAERRRIERDLHDGLQQRLVSIAMSLGLVDARLRSGAGVEEPLDRAREDLDAAIAELRAISRGIHPPGLVERGLAAALGDLRDSAGVPVALEARLESRCSPAVEAAALFVASEGVANVLKHAAGAGARIDAHQEGGAIVIEVRDDGPGGASPGGGTGLRGLADRVEALGGDLRVTSPAGLGTTLRARIPCGS